MIGSDVATLIVPAHLEVIGSQGFFNRRASVRTLKFAPGSRLRVIAAWG
jgi:hypothetical protein